MRVRATLKLRNDKMIQARESAGLTQRQVAELSHSTTQTVGQLEKMDYAGLRPGVLFQRAESIAGVLDLPLADVLPEDLVGKVIPSEHRVVFEAQTANLLDMQTQARHMLPSPAEVTERNDWAAVCHTKIHDAIKRLLSSKERQVIALRFGLSDDGIRHTLDEIGALICLSRERVRTIESRAILKMQRDDELCRAFGFEFED